MATEVTPASLASQVEIAREAHANAGRDEQFAIAVHLPTFAWHGDDAWDLVRPHHWYITWKYDDMDGAHHRRSDPLPAPEIYAAQDASLRDQIVIGTPAEVAGRIRELADAAGGDLHYIARLYFPGLALDVQREAMRIFAEEVAPTLR
jgi:alkanesulfonate monooxygenase SsuD/methylene tetrahydromethanopterin reductase-like flavin-dependent oxidoreductase (luciferase family)